MKVTLRSTTKIVQVRVGTALVPARIWEGETERGIPCQAYITRIACAAAEDASEFTAELIECEPPSSEIEAIPLRMVL